MTFNKTTIIKVLCWASVGFQGALTLIGFATGTWGMGIFFGVYLAGNYLATRSLDDDTAAEERIQRMLKHGKTSHHTQQPRNRVHR